MQLNRNNLTKDIDNVFNFNPGADLSCIMVIFGGTGDLTHRKLMPALYNLQCEKKLPYHFAVVSVGRRDKNNKEYRYEVYDSIRSFARFKIDEQTWGQLRQRIYYEKFNFTEDDGYTRLDTFLKKLDDQYQTGGNRIYYLAVAPEYFDVIVEKLHRHGMARNTGPWQRVVIEKPFGRDLPSARILNEKITAVFTESNTYRIDHYLGKEMLQNIMVIRFANMLFEPVWNNQFIDNIQILSCEKVGAGSRAGYYEQAGALRDMMQNHMLQLLTLTTIEPPASLDTESIRDEKVKVLRSLEQFSPEQVFKNVVRGQYGPGVIDDEEISGYRQEDRVSPTSDTETFIALKVHIDNFRWAGVPFYIRTGKRMPVKSTEIIIQFKPLPNILFAREYGGLDPNLLVIKIQPKEGIFLQFNAKKPGTENIIVPVQMDFCQNCRPGTNSPEAYERLLYDVMRGDSTLFARWDEVEYSWKFVDHIAAAWKERKPNFPNYAAGSWGPAEAAELLARDNREWLHAGDISA
jgi:glucose-6-phosphate 1-dehydrogenase